MPEPVPPPHPSPGPEGAAPWWQPVVRVVRGSSPPTVPIGVGADADAVSQRHARSAVDLALRVGEAMLATGAGAADCVASALRLLTAFGIRSAHVDITFTSITVSVHRGVDEDPLSVMRVIRGRSPDYSRLEAVQRLVEDVAEQAAAGTEPDVDEARRRLTRALGAPHPYRRWVITVANAVLAVGVVMLFGAHPTTWAVAALAAVLVDRVQRRLYAWGVAAFFTQAVSAAVPALLGMGLQWAIQQGTPVPGVRAPQLVVVAGIVLLLAGLGVFGAAQDALDGYYVTAGARGLEVVLLTAGIAVGVGAVIGLANALGVPFDPSGAVVLGGNPVQSTVGAMLVGVGFAASTHSGLRACLVGMVLAGAAWLVLEGALAVGLTGAAGVALSATLVGAVGHAAQRHLRVPEIAVGTAAIVALLPGLAVFRAIRLFLEDNPALVGQAVLNLVSATSTGVGLAAGLSIGAYAARRRFGLDRSAARARRRSRGSAGA